MKRAKKIRSMLLFCAFLATVIAICEISFRANPPDIHSQGRNGIWLRHLWVGDKHSPKEYQRLAHTLTDLHITDAYFHTRPLSKEGDFPASKYANARELVRNIKKSNPDIQLYAWVGQVQAAGDSYLDLSSKDVRKSVLRTVETLLNLGFDGIHYDIEPIYSNDADFLILLRETHELTRSHGKRLSVATHKPEPIRGLGKLARTISDNPGYWEDAYFLKVAREVDQVVVMTYDSGSLLPFIYGALVSRTVKWSMQNGVENLMIGVPTYDEQKGAHFPWAENLQNAILGLKRGLISLDEEDRRKVGAAIFAEWTTSEEEKRLFKEEWLGDN